MEKFGIIRTSKEKQGFASILPLTKLVKTIKYYEKRGKRIAVKRKEKLGIISKSNETKLFCRHFGTHRQVARTMNNC